MKILLLLLFFTSWLHAKLVIISDIDDTLRVVNTTNKKEALKQLLSGVKPYPAMCELLWAIKNLYEKKGEEVSFYYLSSSYKFIYSAPKWLAQNDFPIGNSIQKRLLLDPKNSAQYKADTIAKILHFEGVEHKIIMLGDSGQLDALAYETVKNQLQLKNATIYIRDLGEKSPYRSTDAKYFFSETELLSDDLFAPLSQGDKENIRSQVFIADFVKNNLAARSNQNCATLFFKLLRN